MKIFFDESGQTGCVVKKNDLLNFEKSPTFALGAVVVKTEEEEEIINKYLKFKKIFNINGEIKGTDLLTKNNNDKLEYFLENLLDDVHFYINIYDKRFYLSTLILFSFTGFECFKSMKLDIYAQASILALQDDDFFIEYLNYIDKPSLETFSDYLLFIINYDYGYFKDINGNEIENAIKIFAKKIKDDSSEEYFWKDFMTYGWYKNDKVTNFINLNCLCELVYFIKSEIKKPIKEIRFIHDNIPEFEDTIQDEMSMYNCDIDFKNSNEEILLQLADNIVSIFRHAYDKGVFINKNKEMWSDESTWDLELLSKLQQIISTNHIKYTVPIHDWAATLSIKDMFASDYPKDFKNNFHFNLCYVNYLGQITYELASNEQDLKDVEDCLNE